MGGGDNNIFYVISDLDCWIRDILVGCDCWDFGHRGPRNQPRFLGARELVRLFLAGWEEKHSVLGSQIGRGSS
jgi:hypothetical protein